MSMSNNRSEIAMTTTRRSAPLPAKVRPTGGAQIIGSRLRRLTPSGIIRARAHALALRPARRIRTHVEKLVGGLNGCEGLTAVGREQASNLRRYLASDPN